MAKASTSQKSGTSAGSPAPALDTPSDLSTEATAAVSAALNGIIADAFVLYMKTRNFHWHVSGPNFRDYHLLFDEQAEAILESIDPLAERVRSIGGRTVRSLAEVVRLKSLGENEADFVRPAAMLAELVADNKAVAAAMRKAHAVCDDHDDVASASLLEVTIDQTEKRTWFLFETSRDATDGGH